MSGTLFSPRACGCLSTHGMFLLSVCEGSDSWLVEGWKQAWYPVSPPSRLGQLGRQMRGLRGFCALVLSVTGRPAESWWWEGLQEAWSSSWECCGYTLCPGSQSWAAAREVTDPLVCRKALWFLAWRSSGLSFSPGGGRSEAMPHRLGWAVHPAMPASFPSAWK